MKRTEIMAKIRRDTAFMEKTAVRLDCLDHPAPATERQVVEQLRFARREDMHQALQRVRANLDELEETIRA